MDYFGLGVDLPAVVETKVTKSEKKKNEIKDDKKKTGKRNAKDLIKVGNGITVVSGYYAPEVLTKSDFEAEEVSMDDIKVAFEKRRSEFSSKYFSLNKLSENYYLITLSSYTAKLSKTSPVLEDDYTISLAGFNCIIEKGSGLEEISRIWSNLYPEFEGITDFYRFPESKIIFPCMSGKEAEEFSLPVTIKIFGREDILVTYENLNVPADDEDGNLGEGTDVTSTDNSEEGGKVADEESTDTESFGSEIYVPSDSLQINLSDAKEDLDHEDKTSNEARDLSTADKAEAARKIPIAHFKKLLNKQFKEIKGNYKIITALNGMFFLVPYYYYKAPAYRTVQKAVLYPTDATVGLVFTRFLLHAGIFDGKEQITEDEFLNWLSEDYPEYSKERTVIQYDKEKNLIVPILKSSSKGMETVSNEDLAKELLSKDYALFRYVEADNVFRVEKTPVGTFIALTNGLPGGSFTYHLPKVPVSILKEIYSFFKTVTDVGVISGKGPLEAAVQLFYEKRRGYFLYYPQQRVSRVFLKFERNSELEHTDNIILVADIHSHNIMEPFFSPEDNRDEKETRLFMVMGCLNGRGYNIKLRAGTGGYYINLNPETIFEGIPNFIEVDRTALAHMDRVCFS